MKIKKFYPKTRQEWRDWLLKNHQKETRITVIIYKKHTGRSFIAPQEYMDEAICFGWIDTTVKRLDEERYQRNFVRRNEKGRWSNNTLKYAKRLIKEKKMSPHGLKMYKHGLKKQPIDLILPENHMPIELEKALNRNKAAKIFFENLAPSYRRNYIRWIERAKLPETKAKRILQVIERCSQKKKSNIQ
jgi:uncharacterized protein YdeI (YjbR/CyaY-like superfamily)